MGEEKDNRIFLEEIDDTKYYLAECPHADTPGFGEVSYSQKDDRRNREYHGQISILYRVEVENLGDEFNRPRSFRRREMSADIQETFEGLGMAREGQRVFFRDGWSPSRLDGDVDTIYVSLGVIREVEKPSLIESQEDIIHAILGLEHLVELVAEVLRNELATIKEEWEHRQRVDQANKLVEWFENQFYDRAEKRTRYNARLAGLRKELEVEFDQAAKKMTEKLLKRLDKDEREWDERAIEAALSAVKFRVRGHLRGIRKRISGEDVK